MTQLIFKVDYGMIQKTFIIKCHLKNRWGLLWTNWWICAPCTNLCI